MSRPPRTVRDITRHALDSDAERAWAERMGTDYRRAWETAPTGSILVFLGLHLAATEAGYRRLVVTLVDVLGGDGAEIGRVLDSMKRRPYEQLPIPMESLRDLPGLQWSERSLALRIRARISYESLFVDAKN